MNFPVNPSDQTAAAFQAAVHRRRSVYAYLDRSVPDELLLRALGDAMLAPNHHRTRPWRFFVIPQAAQYKLIAAYEAAARRLGRDVSRAAQRAKDAPVNVVVACAPMLDNPRVLAKEEAFATAAAVQNFLLSLADSGLDSLLTTGDLAESTEVATLVGLDEPNSYLMGVINVGYRNPERPIAPRAPLHMEQLVHWISEN
ncbi:nitroreductase family protein [Pusillimonas noertemannii]|uniref:nitroreductase family protein n=1 Tax=Pusillimonas noertemannii TaxID=305977 RepID=UPI0003801182|nr:nitroreductase family protein [Pusillimonas noertemannii]